MTFLGKNTTFCPYITFVVITSAIGLFSSLPSIEALAYARTGENLYRVIVYSTENRPYAGNGGELLNIRTSGSGEVTVDDILFITEHQAERRFAPLHGGTTGILTVEGSEAVDVYGLDGRQIRRQATTTDGLKKGIYVINGKKHVVR